MSATDTTGLGVADGVTMLEGIFFVGTISLPTFALVPVFPAVCIGEGVDVAASVRLGARDPCALGGTCAGVPIGDAPLLIPTGRSLFCFCTAGLVCPGSAGLPSTRRFWGGAFTSGSDLVAFGSWFTNNPPGYGGGAFTVTLIGGGPLQSWS